LALFTILFYSITKRFTSLCHFVLGLGLSLAPIGAYLSVTGQFHWLPLLFSFVVLLWVSGFDIIYALQDEDFDKEKKLRSIPVILGKRNALILSSIAHLICAGLVVIIGISASFNFYYWIGAVIFIGLLIYQHLLVKPNDLSKVNIAFMTVNGFASVIFAAFLIFSLFVSK
jgi:4-hydroxybenzoate polyprenyltransferase